MKWTSHSGRGKEKDAGVRGSVLSRLWGLILASLPLTGCTCPCSSEQFTRLSTRSPQADFRRGFSGRKFTGIQRAGEEEDISEQATAVGSWISALPGHSNNHAWEEGEAQADRCQVPNDGDNCNLVLNSSLLITDS